MTTNRTRILIALALPSLILAACGARTDSPDLRVQSEMMYLPDRVSLQTCWVTSPSVRRFSLNAYSFYYFEQEGDAPCVDGPPEGVSIYAFDRQFQPELAIRVIEDLQDWLAQDPDFPFLSEVPECQSERPSLGIDLISFPAITWASEIYVDFAIMCPEPVQWVRARIGFSYDNGVNMLRAEDASVIWQ